MKKNLLRLVVVGGMFFVGGIVVNANTLNNNIQQKTIQQSKWKQKTNEQGIVVYYTINSQNALQVKFVNTNANSENFVCSMTRQGETLMENVSINLASGEAKVITLDKVKLENEVAFEQFLVSITIK